MIDLNAIGWTTVNASNPGEFVTLPAGGYVCKIFRPNIIPSKNSKQMIVLCLDIAEGEFANYFSESTKRQRTFDAARIWDNSGIYRQLLKDDSGLIHRFCKGLLLLIEKCNPSYTVNASAFDINTLDGKFIGMVFAEEHYQKRDGSTGVRVVPRTPKTLEDIRNGNFKIPAPVNNNSSAVKPETKSPTTDFTFGGKPVNDEDVPF